MPGEDELDELLEAVDLSSYGLERVKLGHAISLDDEETELDPQNPNPRGVHGGDPEDDPLDDIIRTFNERWFHGWSATPEKQRVKFLDLAAGVKAHPDFASKFKDNTDVQNRQLAMVKIINDVMMNNRKEDMELYKLWAQDEAAKAALIQTISRLVE